MGFLPRQKRVTKGFPTLKVTDSYLFSYFTFKTNEIEPSSKASVRYTTPRALLAAPKGLPKVMENHSDWRRNEWYISLSIQSHNGPSKALSKAARMPQRAPLILLMVENAAKTDDFSMTLERPKGGQRGPDGHPEVFRAASGALMRALEVLKRPPRDLLETSQRCFQSFKDLSISELHLPCERVVRANHPFTCERVVRPNHPFTRQMKLWNTEIFKALEAPLGRL